MANNPGPATTNADQYAPKYCSDDIHGDPELQHEIAKAEAREKRQPSSIIIEEMILHDAYSGGSTYGWNK